LTPNRYPALMEYIHSRNQIDRTGAWCKQLHEDEDAATKGDFADVAADLARAETDFKEQEVQQGRRGYPYNADMGKFLGLPLGSNHEPRHGYYMSRCVASHYRLGVATRAVEAMLQQGKQLVVVTAKKRDGTPHRCARFSGDEVLITGGSIEARNGKTRINLTSNWSTETCIERVAMAMQKGIPVSRA
jgi:hypothetical protein